MYHDQHVQCGFIPSAVWRFSSYYFQLLRCRNLALNRCFLLFLRGRHVSHFGGIHMLPNMFRCSHTFRGPPDAPISSNIPHVTSASVCSRQFLHVMGDLGVPPYVWTLNAFVCSPICLYVLGVICMCYWGNTPYVGGLEASAHLSGFWCLSVYPLDVHYASSTFLVVHYVSSLYYHGYHYYSSSDCGIFWYVISIIVDHGSLFNGASYNVGSAYVWFCHHP